MVDNKSDVDEFFSHYGRVGMRWGRRSSGDTSGAQTNTSNDSKKVKSNSDSSVGVIKKSDHQVSRDLKTKKLSDMSNDEIKTLNSRMQLELAYKSLNAKPQSKSIKFVKTLLGHAATAQSIYSLTNSPMVKAGMVALGPRYAPKHAKGIKAVSGSDSMSKTLKTVSATKK